ncbi:MAG TPA: cysteine desulfurase [Candidatus Dormibacteraeota bacterium]|nr:cysteine desulfurase [Candidatus Dormibacteraeota bacterium]
MPAPTLEAARIRADFPILQEQVNGRQLVYLDSAATSQKPAAVIDAVSDYYRHANANVHRGIHVLGERATEIFEGARESVARLVGADPRGVVFVRNTTEGVNLVAQAFARERFGPQDRILCTEMEHHSNLVPWQRVRDQTGCQLEFIPVNSDGRLDAEATARLLRAPTRLLALTHVSNVLGTINPVAELITQAHAEGITVLVDGAQAVPHMPVDIGLLDADFYAFSAHKMCGPTGIGVLYGRPELLEAMPPFLTGGSMISVVTLEKTTWDEIPHKFEAGTPDIAGAAGLQAAVGYLEQVTMPAIFRHGAELTEYADEMLSEVPGLTRYGPRGADQLGIVSFNLEGVHPHDVGTIVDRCGVAIRAGHHCCQPLMRRLQVAATARASFYLYNTRDDVDALVSALGEANRIFGS